MRSLKKGEKVNAPLAEGCGRRSARRLEAGVRHGGHRRRPPSVPVPLRAGGLLLPPKGTSPSDLGDGSAAESLNCPRLHPVVGDRTQPSGVQTHPLGPPPQRARFSRKVLGGVEVIFPRKFLLGMSGGGRAGHHVHMPPASGRGCGLQVASLD